MQLSENLVKSPRNEVIEVYISMRGAKRGAKRGANLNSNIPKEIPNTYNPHGHAQRRMKPNRRDPTEIFIRRFPPTDPLDDQTT